MRPGDGAKVRGILGVDPALDGVADEADVGLAERERLLGGHEDLLLHEVAPGDEFGDAVLHLDAGVHLHEVVVARGVEQELDGSRVRVVHRRGRVGGGLAHAPAQLLVHEGGGRGRLFDELLVAPLDRALALVQGHHVAALVGHDLDLDVARLLDELLDVEVGHAEGGGGLGLGRPERGDEVFGVADDAHTASPAARRSLHDHGIADVAGHPDRLLLVLENAGRAGNHGHSRP